LINARLAQVEEDLEKTDTASEKRKLRELREDLARLRRVEQIYVSESVRPKYPIPDGLL
jgi:hypothetical protein